MGFQTLQNGLHVYTTAVDAWWSNHVFFDTTQGGVIAYDVPLLNTDGQAIPSATDPGDVVPVCVDGG